MSRTLSEILHEHFPHLIEEHKVSDTMDIHPKLHPIERQKAWDHGLNMGLTTIGDATYHSPGIGRTTSRHSIEVTLMVNEVARWLHLIETQFTGHFDKICRATNVAPADAKFKLRMGENIEIFEETTGKHILWFREQIKSELLN